MPTNPNDISEDGKLPLTDGEARVIPSPNRPVEGEDGKTSETWVALCAQAAVEQDPKRLLELVSKINRLLDVRRKRLTGEDHKLTATPEKKEKADGTDGRG